MSADKTSSLICAHLRYLRHLRLNSFLSCSLGRGLSCTVTAP